MSAKWQKYKPARAFLVTLDIAGFSKDIEPIRLLRHRRSFFNAVEETSLLSEARDSQTVKVHFLGDELRLAYLIEVGAVEVRNFVDDVLRGLERINVDVMDKYQTCVKGVILEGDVTWKTWLNCDYLNGQLPFKAKTWMDILSTSEIAIDEAFRHSLQVDGVPTSSLQTRKFGDEIGYLLRR